MSERATIVIPAPVANAGDPVIVLNYRNGIRERGTLHSSTFDPRGEHWSYDVILERRNQKGTCMHLYVGDEDIEITAANRCCGSGAYADD